MITKPIQCKQSYWLQGCMIASGFFLIATSVAINHETEINRANELGLPPNAVKPFEASDLNRDGRISGSEELAKAEQFGDNFISTLERLKLLKRE